MQNKQCNYALLIFIGPPEVPFIFIKVHLLKMCRKYLGTAQVNNDSDSRSTACGLGAASRCRSASNPFRQNKHKVIIRFKSYSCTRKKLLATANRCEGVYNRAGEFFRRGGAAAGVRSDF